MELIKGGNLREFLLKRKKMGKRVSEEEASQIIGKLLEALAYIHSQNILHRDIKPENICLNSFNDLTSVKIVDFGLGAKLQGSIFHSSFSKCGTFIYMAPEQATKRAYSQAVDIWTCGIIMYILLTRRHPIYKKQDTRESYLEKLIHPTWKFPSEQYFSTYIYIYIV